MNNDEIDLWSSIWLPAGCGQIAFGVVQAILCRPCVHAFGVGVVCLVGTAVLRMVRK